MKLKLLMPLLACVLVSACDRVDPDSPLGKRKALFQQMMTLSEDMGGMLRGRLAYDAEAFAAAARELDALAGQPWQHFPSVREENSSARDELWQRQERFLQLARDTEAATAALVIAVSQPDVKPSDLRAPTRAVEDSCEACHQEFRAY